ncbi:MAG: hypothetical protein HC916_19180 [Coleofasciculaceae cyanobacterium SM2_1_6]|nr:hypothetical protein [Coleofasciculaceae cyanobacterium SM2_1_6]
MKLLLAKFVITGLSIATLAACSTPEATSNPSPTTTSSLPSSPSSSVQVESPASSKSSIEPIPWIEPETTPDPALEQAILNLEPISASNGANTYRYTKVDLNGDGVPEVVVHLSGSSFCGTGGCTTLIFQQQGNQYQLVSRIPTSHAPIIVLGNTTNGWKDLIVYTRDASPALVEFATGGYGDKIYIEPSADLWGTYLFATQYREYQGKEFPLTVSTPRNSAAVPSPTGAIASPATTTPACQGAEKSLLKLTTENYIISICGVTTPEYYVGTEKADPTKSIRLPLAEASPTFFMAVNGDTTYILAQTPRGHFLTVTQGEKELLREVVEGW